MTRRPKTSAPAKAKPAPKSAQAGKEVASGRGTEAPATERKTEAPGKAASKSPRASADAAKANTPAKAGTPTKASAPAKASQAAKASAPAKASKASKVEAPAKASKPSKASAPAKQSKAAKPVAPKKSAPKKAAAPAAATPVAPKAAASKTGKPAAKRPAPAAKTPARRKAPKAPKGPAYLAAELGQPVDREGEPIGAGSAILRSDAALQEYSLRLWRQMQSGGVVNRYMRAIERAGLTVDEVWTAGVIETRPTSSTTDEMRRYKQKLLFRANLLEAILTETIADLHRLDGIVPSDAPSPPPPEQARETAPGPATETS